MKYLTLAACALLWCTPVCADQSASLTIGGHAFSPKTLVVEAGEKIALSVSNTGTEAAEFESAELNREKVVPPGKTVVIYIGPLAPGNYPFFDDFDSAATGVIIAK